MQHQKLGFNDPKEPLNNKKARCIGGDYHPCAREPMALPRYEQGRHFQWLNQGERHQKHEKRSWIRRRSLAKNGSRLLRGRTNRAIGVPRRTPINTALHWMVPHSTD